MPGGDGVGAPRRQRGGGEGIEGRRLRGGGCHPLAWERAGDLRPTLPDPVPEQLQKRGTKKKIKKSTPPRVCVSEALGRRAPRPCAGWAAGGRADQHAGGGRGAGLAGKGGGGGGSGGKAPCVLPPWDFSTLRPTRTSCYGAGGGGCDGGERAAPSEREQQMAAGGSRAAAAAPPAPR